MNIPSLVEMRRRLGPHVWWYSAAAFVLGCTLICLCLDLSIGYFVDRTQHTSTVAAKRARLQAISNEVGPLSGLGKDIDDTRKRVDQFYDERVPSGYSQIVDRLGEIAIRAGVTFSSASYSQGAPGSDLSEISMDVSVAGEYAQLIRFVNGVERDQNFFVVRALSFTGQQSGEVTLHVRISTWIRSEGRTALGTSALAKAPVDRPVAALTGGK